jgi:hypothetical protein
MSEPDLEWITEQLSSFITKATPRNLSAAGMLTAYSGPSAPQAEILAQSLVEWSDNHTVGGTLATQGIDDRAACHLVRRDSVAGPTVHEPFCRGPELGRAEAASWAHHRNANPEMGVRVDRRSRPVACSQCSRLPSEREAIRTGH